MSSPEAPNEVQKKEYSVQGLIEIKEQFAQEFIQLPGVNGIGVGVTDVRQTEIGIVLYLEKMPKKDEDLNKLFNAVRKLPQDVLLRCAHVGTIVAL